MNEFGFNDRLDDMLPCDNATLGEWIEFAKEAFSDAPFVLEHLQDLADRDGRLYQVGFSTKDFLFYLDAFRFGCENDWAKWDYYEDAS
jgi:hypothetical protein